MFGESYEDLCERCSFLKDVVEQSVAARLLIRSGTEQETRWDEENSHRLLSEKGNRWSDLRWAIWEGSAGHTGSRFELFTLPGEF
jgi:hypothetical protein